MRLRRFNHVLSGIVIVLGLYIAVSPFLPTVRLWLSDTSPEARAPYAGALAKSEGSGATDVPIGNRIVIPEISLDEPVYEGSSIGVINDGGTWRRPVSSVPGQPGNTVIVGHRFFGRSVSTFYHLDKLSPGQQLAVYWEGREYLYKVQEVKIVSPNATVIEADTGDTRLTLYTCTPLWTAKERLVVVALPVEEAQ